MISWFITHLRFGWLIIPVIVIWILLLIVINRDHDDNYPWLFSIITIINFIIIIILVGGMATARLISESDQPWNKVYTNDLNASVKLSTPDRFFYEGLSLVIGEQLTDDDVSILSEMYHKNNQITITIGEGNDAASRKVRITSIEGDLTENMTITKIEYRKSTTFHYHALGFDGNSQPSNDDGDIRIVIGRPNNAINNLFGD